MRILDIPLSFLEKIKQLRAIGVYLRSEFFYYEVRYLIEVEWESYFLTELNVLNNSDLSKYNQDRLSIHMKFKKEVFQSLGFGHNEIEEMYHRYGNLLSYVGQDGTVWQYKKELKR